jgi:hypothetical protein
LSTHFGITVWGRLGRRKEAWLINGQRDREGIYWAYIPATETENALLVGCLDESLDREGDNDVNRMSTKG